MIMSETFVIYLFFQLLSLIFKIREEGVNLPETQRKEKAFVNIKNFVQSLNIYFTNYKK